MIEKGKILEHLDKYDYDIRKTGNGRWIDQKCTPDVLSIVADCVHNYINDNGIYERFTSKDIWHSEYTESFVEQIFSKPNTKHEKTTNEYDKFFSQPLELLAHARILKKSKIGRSNYYRADNLRLLEFISIREFNSLNFLIEYIKKVLQDSNQLIHFSEFFDKQTPESFIQLKTQYEDFIIKNTKINGVTEVRRIFTKVLNPLAYSKKKKGTQRGRLSKNIITLSMLMYNQENFRDISSEKPKNMTRQEWELEHQSKINKEFFKYQSSKAKSFIKKYNDEFRNSKSEVNDEYSSGVATQIHHIFPEGQFPQIAMYYENLIALTPTQHFNKAHPNNHTYIIDEDYQEILLKAKAGTIKEDLTRSDEPIYSFENFITVINVGFNTDYEIVGEEYLYVMEVLNSHYCT